MRPWILPAAAVAAFMVGLVAFAPMRAAVVWAGAADAGLSAARIEGTIWSGTLTDARLRGFPLGDVEAAVDPLALLTGKVRLSVKSELGEAVLVNGELDGVGLRTP